MTGRPTMDETLLATAFVMAERGTCSRAQAGCVVALDGRILSTGYNGAPRGMTHCVHEDGVASVDRSADEPTCATAVHAEANAVAFAARTGVSLDGSTVFTTLSPCVACAQLLINVGAHRVVCAALYRSHDGVELLLRAGIVVDVLTEGVSAPIQPLTAEDVEDLDVS